MRITIEEKNLLTVLLSFLTALIMLIAMMWYEYGSVKDLTNRIQRSKKVEEDSEEDFEPDDSTLVLK